jgi:hypothetical protein
MFMEVIFEVYHVFVIYPSKNTSLNMVTKVRVKSIPEQATKAQRKSRGIAVLYL